MLVAGICQGRKIVKLDKNWWLNLLVRLLYVSIFMYCVVTDQYITRLLQSKGLEVLISGRS